MTNSAPILLIGGTNGSGKTRLAGELAAQYSISHRLGTGFVREVVRSETDPTLEPDLFGSSYGSAAPVNRLIGQSQRLFSAIQHCIVRADAEGTSLIIEGTHLLPDLYWGLGLVDGYVVLAARTTQQHM